LVLKKIFLVIVTLISIILLVGCSTNNIDKKSPVQTTPTPIANASTDTKTTAPKSTDPNSTAAPITTLDTQALDDSTTVLNDLTQLDQMDDVNSQDTIFPTPQP